MSDTERNPNPAPCINNAREMYTALTSGVKKDNQHVDPPIQHIPSAEMGRAEYLISIAPATSDETIVPIPRGTIRKPVEITG